MQYLVRAIGHVSSTRREVVDDNWDAEQSSVVLSPDVPSEALDGIEAFSHVELVLLADRASDAPPAPWLRHPRGNERWPKVGVFAQRNKDRPNRLLVSVATLVARQERGLIVHGLDAVDGTPVLDIKPVFSWNGPRGAFTAPAWSEELVEGYF